MADERLEIDHVVIGVTDLGAAAARLLDEHGLVALSGGLHPAWGTANRIVPLGPTYLELVAVVDPDVAAGSAFGTWVADMAAGRCAGGWAVRTHDMAATASRLDLDVVPGSRIRADGVELRWQLAGVPSDATSDRALPFVISWAEGTPPPGSAPVAHRDGDVRLDRIGVECDPSALDRWLGAHLPSVEAVTGTRGVTSIRCTSRHGALELGLPF